MHTKSVWHVLWRKCFQKTSDIWPTMFCSSNPMLTTWHDMAKLPTRQEELGKEMNCVFEFRRGKRVASSYTQHYKSRQDWKIKIYYLQSWTLYHIMSWLLSIKFTYSIQSSLHQAFWPKLMQSPPQLIPEFKQSKNDQKTLCVDKRLIPPTIKLK